MEDSVMVKKESIEPQGLWKPLGVYSHAIKASGTQWLFLSGVTPRDEKGHVVGKNDIRKQTEKVFENMKAVLDGAGATFENIVKATTYVRDVGYYDVIQEVRARYYKEPFPASTLLQVQQLSSEDILIEVEVIAFL
jgi:2-iminobutanoate/2-iminopropanoate deaminase